jgi:DNA-binding transcriptional ArsR family regulator
MFVCAQTSTNLYVCLIFLLCNFTFIYDSVDVAAHLADNLGMEKPNDIIICRLIADSGKNVATRLAEVFGVSRQAASAWLSRMKVDGIIRSEGIGRGTVYSLVDLEKKTATFPREGLSEDLVWRELCFPVVRELPENVRSIWHHGITEMVNNAIDHSGSDQVTVMIARNALHVDCWVCDSGEGIFLKIQKALDLYDTREAILELAKGKFTTDPAKHSGEGIFFSSKMFNSFIIRSRALAFVHIGNEQKDLDVMVTRDKDSPGTSVNMQLDNFSTRTTREVFDKFALPEEFSFAKTVVPVKLAQHEGETLVSRSQAKRLTRRFERFQTVILDFTDVTEIGQAFADEVFRVFANAHPKLKMVPTGLTPAVRSMIKRVQTVT